MSDILDRKSCSCINSYTSAVTSNSRIQSGTRDPGALNVDLTTTGTLISLNNYLALLTFSHFSLLLIGRLLTFPGLFESRLRSACLFMRDFA